MTAITKQLLRNKLAKIRNNISQRSKNIKDKLIEKKILNFNQFKKSKTVMFFVSFRSEVNTIPLIKKSLALSKRVVLPKVVKKSVGKLVPIEIENIKTDIKLGTYGILEPYKKEKRISLKKIDLVFIPALAFDLSGHRIGYGGGYYDIFLKKMPLEKSVGLAYEFQVLNKIPYSKTDRRVSKIITEKGVKICHNKY